MREESTDQNPNYQWAKAELTKAEADLAGLRARADAAAAISIRYHQLAEKLNREQVVQQDLQREAKTQEDNYFLYLQKREEARISDALDQRGILNVALAEQPVVPALPENSPLRISGGDVAGRRGVQSGSGFYQGSNGSFVPYPG